jgi:hypothetical protein
MITAASDLLRRGLKNPDTVRTARQFNVGLYTLQHGVVVNDALQSLQHSRACSAIW